MGFQQSLQSLQLLSGAATFLSFPPALAYAKVLGLAKTFTNLHRTGAPEVQMTDVQALPTFQTLELPKKPE